MADMKDVDPTLATGVRSVIMTIVLVGMCFVTGAASKLTTISLKSFVLIVL